MGHMYMNGKNIFPGPNAMKSFDITLYDTDTIFNDAAINIFTFDRPLQPNFKLSNRVMNMKIFTTFFIYTHRNI